MVEYMEIYGWGRYPRIEAEVLSAQSLSQLQATFTKALQPIIARGLGRSYGDSANSSRVLDMTQFHHFLGFDPSTGVLNCQAGVSLADIAQVFVPKGWFIPASPGTGFVTVGGAIASDVHGKNHHIDGTFTKNVYSIQLLLGNGEVVEASRKEHSDLFHATCGGMGLTGVILSAEVQLRPICSSRIRQKTIIAKSLDDIINKLEENYSSTYSVAWIDCMASGENLGRSVLLLGEHAEDEVLQATSMKSISVPIDMPVGLLNKYLIKTFNSVYYGKADNGTKTIPYEAFFYPLDKLADWNKLYGKDGFLQYQFVVPKESGLTGLRKILNRIAASKKGSFQSVLKVLGKANDNLLSFPIEGYTLAVDFKTEPTIFDLLTELDQVVLNHGGRIYLTKDARMSQETFRRSYLNWHRFEEIRHQYHAIGKLSSKQSKRLGLE